MLPRNIYFEALGWTLIVISLALIFGTAFYQIRWYTRLPLPGRSKAVRRNARLRKGARLETVAGPGRGLA